MRLGIFELLVVAVVLGGLVWFVFSIGGGGKDRS
jgi:hypothetical protein